MLKGLKEQRGTLDGEIKVLNTELEGKTPTKEQRDAYLAKVEKLEELNGKIEFEELREKTALEAEARSKNTTAITHGLGKSEERAKQKAVDNYSFGRAIRQAYGIDKLEGAEKEMQEEGQRDMTGIGKAAPGFVIPHMVLHRAKVEKRAVITENDTTGIEVMPFIQSVYAETILGQLGISTVNSASDQRIPIIGAVTTKWEGEADDAADGGSATTKKDLTPIRAGSFVDYTKQAAMQHNESLENALRIAIAQSLAAKVEYTTFTDDTTEGGFADIGAGKTAVTSGTVNGMVLAAMEEIVGNNHNRGNLGFAISHTLFQELYSAVLVTGVSPLVMNNLIMGKPFGISSQIADIAATQESIYYGDWTKWISAQFGGIEILVDQYTQALGGKNRLHLNSYWDGALIQDAAISVAGFTG